ncbi:MAG: ATP-binding protein [Thermodesulfobacteriota bacterium]
MRTAVPAVLRGALFAFLLLSSAAVLYSTFLNARTIRSLAESSLESTALALSFSAESALRLSGDRRGEDVREILSDRVVAFALIADAGGKILFHTNPARVGRSLEEGGLRTWLQGGRPHGRRVTLGTGLPAYEYNYVLHRPDGGAELLRLVIHTARADLLLGDIRRMWWAVGAALAVLWGVGIALERVLTRQLRLQEEAGRRERLALIGQMTAALSHEIRNALGSVKGYTQWVDEKVDPSDPRKQGLAFALKGMGRIESLVNELLLYARQETYAIGPVDLRALAEPLVREETAGWGGRAETEFGDGARAMADPEKLRRVLSNGIRNAVQAMGGEGSLRVSARPEGNRVRLRIEDSGPGIPESERDRLFTPFHTTKTDGTGLGLAYSKKAIEGMRGSIALRNREGGGAVLEIFLPMER